MTSTHSNTDGLLELCNQYKKEKQDLINNRGLAKHMSKLEIKYAIENLTEHINNLEKDISLAQN